MPCVILSWPLNNSTITAADSDISELLGAITLFARFVIFNEALNLSDGRSITRYISHETKSVGGSAMTAYRIA